MRRVGARGLQAETVAVGRVPPRGAQECEILGLGAPLLRLGCVVILLSGCSFKTGKENQDFFTSGNPAADLRASQQVTRSSKDTAKDQAGQAEDRRALFDRLGGTAGLTAIVDDFTPRVMQDPRVNWARHGVHKGGLFSSNRNVSWEPTPQNVENLKKSMVQFLALTTGGPSEYQGRNIKTVHTDMKITGVEFDAAMGDLKASLDRLKVADREQKDLLAIVESTRQQIVTEE